MSSGGKIRPLTSRVKASVFDILPVNLHNQVVLDLFAGTGSFGIEALSRGADFVLFVDQSRKAGELIKANLRKLGCYGQAEVMVKKVSVALNQLNLEGLKFDLVFIDPPFDRELMGRTLEQLSQLQILAPDAVVVARTSVREKTRDKYGLLIRKDLRKYGDSIVSFYVQGFKEEIEEKGE